MSAGIREGTMRAIGFAAVLMLASAGAAEAGEWRYASNSDTVIFGFDAASVIVNGRSRSFWSVQVERQTKTVGDVTFDYSVARTVVDCDRVTKSETTTAYYLISRGSPVYVFESGGTARNQLPDSVGATFVAAVCAPPVPNSAFGSTAEEFAIAARRTLFSMIQVR